MKADRSAPVYIPEKLLESEGIQSVLEDITASIARIGLLESQ